MKLPSRHVCQPSLLETCYTIQHVGCCELICDLYQSLPHQLWVGSTSVACETSVKFSTGIVCSPSHVPPPCWRTHYAISVSLITLEGAALASLSLTPPSLPLSLNRHTLGQKLHHPILPTHMGRKKLDLYVCSFWGIGRYLVLWFLPSRVLLMFLRVPVFVHNDTCKHRLEHFWSTHFVWTLKYILCHCCRRTD